MLSDTRIIATNPDALVVMEAHAPRALVTTPPARSHATDAAAAS